MKNIGKVPSNFKKRYNKLIQTEKLEELTTIGTTDPSVMRERFAFVYKELFK